MFEIRESPWIGASASDTADWYCGSLTVRVSLRKMRSKFDVTLAAPSSLVMRFAALAD